MSGRKDDPTLHPEARFQMERTFSFILHHVHVPFTSFCLLYDSPFGITVPGSGWRSLVRMRMIRLYRTKRHLSLV